jgi:hypothetical protein
VTRRWMIGLGLIAVAIGAMTGIRRAGAADSGSPGFRSYAKYLTEEDAIRHGEQMGLGEATLETPRDAVVDGSVQLKLKFRVGRAGMKTGGGIRLATAHGMGGDWGGMRLQVTDPSAANYLTFSASTGSGIQWKTYSGVGQNPLFNRYHPWQFLNEFKLAGAPLKEGDTIEIAMGGAPGVRLQQWDEKAFVLKFYVDALGDDDYLPLKKSPAFRIAAGPAKVLHAIGPSDAETGKPTWLNVWAEDGFGNPSDTYRGTIVFEADGAGGLPAEYTFREADRGAHRFEGIVLRTSGAHRIRVQDKNHSMTADSNPLVAQDQSSSERIYWGDIHTHTMYSDGRGTPEETYDFGKRISALDFTAVTDHSFLTEDWMWEDIKKTTNRFYQPGRFVTFLAYEWSGQSEVGGDHNVYTTDAEMPIIRCYSYFNYQNLRMYHGPNKGANHVEDLFRMLAGRMRNENLMVIPHYGGRHGNPAFHNPDLQRSIEIFSDHRRSEDWATQFLKNGYRLGIMASTDNHAGNAGFGVRRAAVTVGEEGEVFERRSPAENGTALVAVYAPELTRKGIFQGMYHRRTYATTGTRIVLDFELNGAPMGSETRASGPPKITASAEGTAPITLFRLVKDGKVVHAVSPNGLSAHLEFQDLSGDYKGKFYYIDLVQEDGKKAISSPIWVE